ncbi:hypothetical protein TGAM01_v206248 [Trichoderma gamsii]|uniref:Uncharacterized protein n=1 Tax=Trichoderma gamsii TaxID=398673 RepID=A0A2P4ZKA8_9HYPO|nr:hypothetical protein TGAM01_v206248 [Trichoderma gamsii]PON24740.1 hypothetical protein TGAM01_v206248 [Trichoderma gamsii]
MLVRCCVSYFDLISCFESCWQLALSEHDIWLTEGNGKGQGKKSRINKSNCEAEKRRVIRDRRVIRPCMEEL